MLTYSDLREIQKKELSSAAIVPLDKDFYGQLKDMLAKKRKEALESGLLLTMREYENIKRIAVSIHSRREEKLLLMAIRGECNAPGLSEGEATLLTQVADLINKQRSMFTEAVDDKEASQFRRVRILKDIEQYVGLDKGVYGPFKSGEEHMLLKDEAEWLLKARMAELVK